MNSQELIDKYLMLCSESRKYGSEVGDGWIPTLDKLFAAIDALELEDMKVHQFKQKFGYLRVYMNRPDSKVDMLISQAEATLLKVCETCGEIGKLFGDGYVRVTCEECKKKK